MAEVQILSRTQGQQTSESGVPKPVLVVTYSTAEVPPRVVTVPLDRSTDEDVAAAIRADLESMQKGPSETLTI